MTFLVAHSSILGFGRLVAAQDTPVDTPADVPQMPTPITGMTPSPTHGFILTFGTTDCSSLTNCWSCAADTDCAWCLSMNGCYNTNSMPQACRFTAYSDCCVTLSPCDTCVQDSRCGFCADAKVKGCMSGNATESIQNCPTAQWQYGKCAGMCFLSPHIAIVA